MRCVTPYPSVRCVTPYPSAAVAARLAVWLRALLARRPGLLPQGAQLRLLLAPATLIPVKLEERGASGAHLPVRVKMLRLGRRGPGRRVQLVCLPCVHRKGLGRSIDGILVRLFILCIVCAPRHFAAWRRARAPKLVEVLHERVVGGRGGGRLGVALGVALDAAHVPVDEPLDPLLVDAALLPPRALLVGARLALERRVRRAQGVVVGRRSRRLGARCAAPALGRVLERVAEAAWARRIAAAAGGAPLPRGGDVRLEPEERRGAHRALAAATGTALAHGGGWRRWRAARSGGARSSDRHRPPRFAPRRHKP